MKLQFDTNLQYQEQAVSSVVDLFRGQTPKQSNFTISAYAGRIGMEDDALRPTEYAKIKCGEKHFGALGEATRFVKADEFKSFAENTIG